MPNPDPRYGRIQARDASADGQFWFGVVTTGVYCRPSCRARTPRPENVRYFVAQVEATAAGFRACLRCRPDLAPKRTREAEVVAELCRYLEATESPPPLRDLADRAGWSPSHTRRVFQAITGLTPKGWLQAKAAEKMQASLQSEETITDAIYAAGYSSSGRYYASTHQALGMTPSAYRAGGAGVTLSYATAPCPLGRVLVACTPRGIAAVLLGDDDDLLLEELAGRFPQAERRAAPVPWLTQVVATLEDPRRAAPLPLDLAGTQFQRRVWDALRRIPPGAITTYGALAQELGAPRSVRAVAQACGQNPAAVLIPCHRVLGKSGELTGYRWGVPRKQALLELEGAQLPRRSRKIKRPGPE